MPGEIDLRSLGIGLGIVVFLYMSVLLYAFFSASSTYDRLESTLANHRIFLIAAEETAIADMVHTLGSGDTNNTLSDSQEGALVRSPLSGLTEDTDYGKLPVIRSHDSMTSFKAYKRPLVSRAGNQPSVAILVADFGLSPKTAKIALETLPPEVSFLLSPYAQSPATWRELARRKGHESWLNVPVENKDITHADPGPAALLTRETSDKTVAKLNWIMARTTGYVGLAAFNDESYLMGQKTLGSAFKSGLERGLAYLELNPASKPYLEAVALNSGIPYLQADSWVYTNQGKNSLEDIEKIARQKGIALGVVPPWPNTIKMLEKWTGALEEKGIALVPVSAIPDVLGNNILKPGDRTGSSQHEMLETHNLEERDHIEPEKEDTPPPQYRPEVIEH